MNEENKNIESLNPLNNNFDGNAIPNSAPTIEPIEQENNIVEPTTVAMESANVEIPIVEPMPSVEPIVTPLEPAIEPIEQINSANINVVNTPTIDTQSVEPLQEKAAEPKEFVEVLDIDESKPSVISEQVKDSTTQKKEQSKAGITLVIAILVILILFVIFLPQITELLK